MKLFGLIGYPLEHSASPALFREKFASEGLADHDYRLFPLEDPAMVRPLAEAHPGLRGLNVTVPYKERIIPFLDHLDKNAAKIEAVNTIRITRKSGRIELTGYNTDMAGFMESADFSAITAALILGTGGAAKAVARGLKKMHIQHYMVSRSPQRGHSIGYNDLTPALMNEVQLIVNATPCGMFPDVKAVPPIPFGWITPAHFLYDLIYNPEETLFLQHGRKTGCRTLNGMAMLKRQAELSYEIWTA